MLEIDARRGALWREPHLDLAGLRDVRLVLPVPRNLPRHHEPMWRLPHEHRPPLAVGPIHLLGVAAAAGASLEDDALHRRFPDVVRAGPPAVAVSGKDLERPFRAGIHGDALADGRVVHGR